MARFAKRIAAVTAILVAVGGLLAAVGGLNEAWVKACSVFSTHCKLAAVDEQPPVIPSYTTDWVEGGGGHRYCEPRLRAWQAQYPNFNITLTGPDGEHKSYNDPFKRDVYRYTCIFTASRKG
jgi:hypothetical protein